MRKPPRLTLVCADEPSREVCDAIRMVAHLNSPTAILVFSAVVDPPLLSGWRGCPLRGYVVKDDSLDDLAQGIQALLAGGTFFSAGARAALVETDGATRNRLSRRESELLPLLARGCSLRDAAERMAISYKTADSYRTSLLRKLGLRDRVQLTRFAIREKIVDP